MTVASKQIRFFHAPEQIDTDESGSINVKDIFRETAPSKPDDAFLSDLNLTKSQGRTFNGIKIGTTPCHASHAVEIRDANNVLKNGLILIKKGMFDYEEAYIAGAPVANHFSRVGKHSDTILLTESYAIAQKLYHATGYCVAVSFHVANIEAVCKILKERYPETKLIVYAEATDESVSAKRRLAATIDAARRGGALVAMSGCISMSSGKDPEDGMSLMRHAVEKAAMPNGAMLNPVAAAIFEHDDPIPWGRPLNGNALFENVVVTISKYVVLPPHAIRTIALWVFFSYLVDIFDVAPILALCSPEKRCGKTTLEELLGELVYRPKLMSNITPAGFYLAIDESCSTMIIDECDTFLFPSQQLIGMINSGYKRKGGKVIRGGRNNKSSTYNLFGAKVLAMIGAAPSSIEDRAHVIGLLRKKPDEIVSRLSDAVANDFLFLRAQIIRWCADNMDKIRAAKPVMPNLGSDRAVDNWEPLLRIAACISQECLDLATAAAHALYESQVDDSMSPGEELLLDIRSVLLNHHGERITTKALIAELCRNPERPWASFDGRNPISARQLSTHLIKYGIKSKNVRIDDDVLKGYESHQFLDAFERYLPADDIQK